jgi:hypothetical protein
LVLIAGWSSPVARQAHNLKVVSSNLAPATNFIKTNFSQTAFGRFLRLKNPIFCGLSRDQPVPKPLHKHDGFLTHLGCFGRFLSKPEGFFKTTFRLSCA